MHAAHAHVQALHLFAQTHQQITELVSAIPDQRWAEQPHGVRNHAAWTLPHLVVGIDFVLELLGHRPAKPEADWSERFGGNSAPIADRGAYPSHDVALATFSRAHESLAAAVTNADPSAFDAEMPIESVRPYFPEVGHAAWYMLCSHEPHHHGQLAVWRRALGLAPN